MLKKSKSIQSLKILFKKYYKSSQWSILEKPSVRYMIFRINRYFNQLVLLTNLFAMYFLGVTFSSVQFSSVTQLFLTLCDPMDCSPPGLPVHHQCPEFTQTHVHQASGAIQPSYHLSSPSLPTFNLSQNQGLFKWVGSSHQVAKVLEFQLQHQSFQRIFRTDFL